MKISYISIILLFACHSDPKTVTIRVNPNHCFIKATKHQLDLTNERIDFGGTRLELLYSRYIGQAYTVGLVGNGWEEFWKNEPAGILKQGDIVYTVDDCSQDDITQDVGDDSGSFYLNPYLSDGYISKINLLLIGPSESIAANIKTVVIRRGGRKYRLTVRGIRDGKLLIDSVGLGK